MPTRATHQRSGRSAAGLLGSATCFALTALCSALAWTIVFTLRIGPVIGTVDARAGRGVHSGDLLAIPLLLIGLFVYAEGMVGIQGHGDRGLRHREAVPVGAPVIHIRPASSALLAVRAPAA